MTGRVPGPFLYVDPADLSLLAVAGPENDREGRSVTHIPNDPWFLGLHLSLPWVAAHGACLAGLVLPGAPARLWLLRWAGGIWRASPVWDEQ